MPERYKRKANTECFNCQRAIYRRPSKIETGRVFCSQACYGISNRNESPCLVCGKSIMAQFHKKTCSRSCSNIHREGIKYKMGSPHDKVKSQFALKIRLLKDRAGKCQRCDYNKQEILHVHHIDRNRKNNELSNLELICPNCHYEEHHFHKLQLIEKIGNV